MDGVIYRGSQLIKGSDVFLRKLKSLRIPYLLLTNNSQGSRNAMALKLTHMGIPTKSYEIFTCSMATARFVARSKPNGSAYLIAENGMEDALRKNGYSLNDQNPDFVIVGEGNTINIEMIEKAIGFISQGASLIATSLDATCTSNTGIRPGCGAIVSMIESATGKKAFSVGKPSPVMMRMARKALMLRTEQTIVVGDTMHTDILGAVQMGYRSALVLSGKTKETEISDYAYTPDIVVPTLNDLPDAFFYQAARSKQVA